MGEAMADAGDAADLTPLASYARCATAAHSIANVSQRLAETHR